MQLFLLKSVTIQWSRFDYDLAHLASVKERLMSFATQTSIVSWWRSRR